LIKKKSNSEAKLNEETLTEHLKQKRKQKRKKTIQKIKSL